MTAIRWTILLAIAALATASACSSGGGGDPAASFQDVYDLGIDQYLGTVEPTGTQSEGDFVSYDFDPADGPECMDGSRFRPDFRHTESENLMIFFPGGGACWSDLCAASFFTIPGPLAAAATQLLNVPVDGTPLGSWNLASLSYCDGSLFSGDADHDDDGDGTVDRFQRGLRNMSAGLDAAKREFPNPRRIVIAGASGGGYSTIIAPFLVRRVWPDAPIDVINDAGVGLAKPNDPSFVRGLLDEFNITRFIPESCVDCTGNGHVTRFIDWQLAHDRNLRIAAISSLQDFVIGTVFLHIPPQDFQAALTSETATLADRYPGRYERFLYPGVGHTVIYVGLDSVTVQGTNVATWLQAMLEHGDWDSIVAE
ncbi:MAG: pectin acetylesterase-family hydrolase [bacterium]